MKTSSCFKVSAIRVVAAFFSLVLLASIGWSMWRQQQVTEELRRQLAATDAQLALLSHQTDDNFNNLKTEIAASRRQSRSDLARMSGGLARQLAASGRDGGELSGRLDAMAHASGGLSQRLDEVARVGSGLSDRLGAVEREGSHLVDRMDEMARQVSDLSQAGAAPAPVVAAAPASSSDSSPSPAQTDLAVARQIRAGKKQFDAGRYDESRKTFQAVQAVSPDNTEVRLYCGVSLFRSNPSDATHYPQVEKDLRSVLSGDGSNVLALETLSLVQMERGRWADAHDLLQKLLVLEPDNVTVIKAAGFCAIKVNDLGAARDLYAKAVTLHPGDREALSAFGDCECGLGDAAAAEQAWKSGLAAVDPQSSAGAREGVALSVKLARSAAGRGSWEESLAYARSGQQMGPSQLLRTYEGLSLVKLGKSSEGRSILTQTAKSDDAEAADLASRSLQEPPP